MENTNIVFARIDNRLVHGQVGMVWANASGANLLLVVDDEVVNDPMQQQLMEMAISTAGIGIRFWSVEQTIQNIHKASSRQKIFIVTKTPLEMRKLVEAGLPIKSVNIGNMHSGKGKERYKSDYVYVDQEDIENLDRIKEKGTEINIQVLPEYKKEMYD